MTKRLGKKRLREEESGAGEGDSDEESQLESNLTFNDTLIALRMMCAQFPKNEKLLKNEKILRLFKLNTGQDDHAIMFFEDYMKQMDIAVKKLGSRNQHDIEVFEWFKIHVIEFKLDVSIDHQELVSLLSAGGDVKDKDVTLLINAGLLTRQMIDPNMYWFSIPNIGSVLKGLSQGRKELVSLLKRRKYKEMLLSLLEKKRLRLSPLDMRFHLRDLIGSGHVKLTQTPSGMIVRIPKD